MSKIKKKLKEEKGSMTLEFLMVMPYYFFFFLLLWQAVASGITFMNVQSAVNEAAKTYSVTGDTDKAFEVAQNAIGFSDIMYFENFSILPKSSKEFVAKIEVKHGLVFIPKEWRNTIQPFDIDLEVASRMIR
ncbi:MAG TPA: pilus assembly protein [Bacillales bacterium]|nr:pilus assembly protein [Bacillales bacterium]